MSRQQQQHQQSHSNMNLHTYQQMNPSSQRQLFQQQAQNRHNANLFASTGQINTNQNRNQRNFRGNNQQKHIINENKEESPEPSHSIDHKHESFLPPALQSKQQVEQYVNWRAKRTGMDKKMCIDLEIERRAKIEQERAEKEKKDAF